MKLKALLTIVALMVVGGAMPANARPFDGSMWSNSESESATSTSGKHSRSAHRARRTHNSNYSGGLGGRPGKWCGWWMRTQKGGGPEFNLAANWRRYGSPTSAQIGAVVVWPHHVGMITGRTASGQWIVKSGNDGGRVRERARSVAGAVFRI
jgi:hypothetical protein